MATLQQLFNFPKSPGLKEKVAAACWRTAKNIFVEPDSTTNHAERLQWAVKVLRAGDSEDLVMAEMLRAVVTMKDTDQITDPDIEAAVVNAVNAFATSGI